MLSRNTPSHSLPGEALCDNKKNHYLGYYSTSRYTGYSCLTENMTLSQSRKLYSRLFIKFIYYYIIFVTKALYKLI